MLNHPSDHHICRVMEWLEADRKDIESTFFQGRPVGRLKAFKTGLSDPHFEGFTVSLLQFENGFRLIMKPRSLAVDRAFHGVLSWLESINPELSMARPKVLDRGDHGWMEFIDSRQEPTGPTMVSLKKFYFRQGIHLALFHCLDGGDFHNENFMVSSDAEPIAVDLECLMTASLDRGDAGTLPSFLRSQEESVLHTQMLPVWLKGGMKSGVKCMTGMAFPEPEKCSIDESSQNINSTDEICADGICTDGIMEMSDPVHWVETINDGFRKTMRVILENRDSLLSPEGPFEVFRGLKMRIINRSTDEYFKLLERLSEPEFMKSEEAYDKGLDQLNSIAARLWNSAAFAESEKRSLRRGDIPVYHICSVEREIYIDGELQTYTPVTVDGFTRSSERIRSLSEEHIQLQEKIIASALGMQASSGFAERKTESAESADAAAETETGCTEEFAPSLMNFAIDCGESLAALAISDNNGARWLGLASLSAQSPVLYTHFTDGGMVSGTAGIALFLANLASATGMEKFAELACGALDYSVRFNENLRTLGYGLNGEELSAFGGLISIAHAHGECGRVLHRPDLISRGLQLMNHCTEIPSYDDSGSMDKKIPNPDFMNGMAGALKVMLQLTESAELTEQTEQAEQTEQTEWKEHIKPGTMNSSSEWMIKSSAIGDVLMKMQLPSGGWQVPGFHQPLLGLAHGAAGISMSLAGLWARSPSMALLRSIERALDFEACHFDSECGDWPNLQVTHVKSFMRGWCGGAAGAGLARLSMIASLERGLGLHYQSGNLSVDSQSVEILSSDAAAMTALAGRLLARLEQELELAVAACETRLFAGRGFFEPQLADPPVEGHHLCCGRSGIAWFLHAVALSGCGSPKISSLSESVMKEMVNFYRQRGFLSLQGIDAGLIIPGLLNGISGLGLTALKFLERADNGERVSDPLTLG